MAGLFSKIFGGSKKAVGAEDEVIDLVKATVDGLIEKGQFKFSYEIRDEQKQEGDIRIEFFGEDEHLLTDKEGMLLEAVQLYLKRVIQHNFPTVQANIIIDCNGFREDTEKSLVELAEKLKEIALTKGKSVYFRALDPKDRKIVHQHIAKDTRVKSRSVGEGLYKKIKIFPAKSTSFNEPSAAN